MDLLGGDRLELEPASVVDLLGGENLVPESIPKIDPLGGENLALDPTPDMDPLGGENLVLDPTPDTDLRLGSELPTSSVSLSNRGPSLSLRPHLSRSRSGMPAHLDLSSAEGLCSRIVRDRLMFLLSPALDDSVGSPLNRADSALVSVACDDSALCSSALADSLHSLLSRTCPVSIQ